MTGSRWEGNRNLMNWTEPWVGAERKGGAERTGGRGKRAGEETEVT